jgi:hypothetical protein
MKKLFGFGKKDTPNKQNEKFEQTKQQMQNYKGQAYNPAEDDGITTESMFKVVDGDTGEVIDVRELLGLTEEDFKENPDLLNVLKHMNAKAPIAQPSEQ